MNDMLKAALQHARLEDVLRLIRSEQVGPRTFYRAVEKCGSVEAALEQLPSLAAAKKRQVKLAHPDDIAREIEATHKAGARFLVAGTPDYPAALYDLHDYPPILAIKGQLPTLHHLKKVALVGARNASAHGCALTRKLAKELGEAGFVVVSGLARGVDGAAHSASLSTGTIGVMANGIDQIYPPEHAKLAELMIEKAGVIVTEQPLGMAPHARAFPARNRIIAALSQGVVVVEAAFKSGSLITAQMALELGREVMAVPGSPLDPRCQGTNQLIKDGAALIADTDDVLKALHSHANRLPLAPAKKPLNFSDNSDSMQHTYQREDEEDWWLADDEMRQTDTDAVPFSPQQEVSEDATARVERMLSHTMIDIEELALQSGVDAPILHHILLELELADRLQRGPGQKVALKAAA